MFKYVELEPSAGAMVTVDRRVCNQVLNLLAPPSDGDIIVPQRNTSIATVLYGIGLLRAILAA